MEVGGELVLKSQVLSRRPHEGRWREVRVVARTTRAPAAEHILKLEIGGQMPRCVLVESKQPVKQEYYAGVIYDAVAKLPVAIFSDMGGIDIEEVAEKHPEHVARAHFSTFQPLQEFKFKELVASLGITWQRAEPALAHRRSARAGVPADTA